MSVYVTFIVGMAFTKDSIVIAAAGDDLDVYAPLTRLFQYHHEPTRWWSHDVEWRASAVTYFGPEQEAFDDFVVMSEEGHVHYVGEHDPVTEKIPGAGVFSEDAEGWGYLSGLKQIGQHLYACGGGGQIYKRVQPLHWVHMDKGLLQTPGVPESLLLSAIDGPHEDAIYTAGSLSAMGHPPKVYFWNGLVWRELPLPPVAERINAIHVESESRIWLCGANGTLLLGNEHDGFKSLSTVNDNQLFYSICLYQGIAVMGSNLGLFCYDPKHPEQGIRELITGLTPELQDANVVDAVDGVLWSIGSKDIARFDGKTWERIHHPDNPPIGGGPSAPAAPAQPTHP